MPLMSSTPPKIDILSKQNLKTKIAPFEVSQPLGGKIT